MQDVHDSPEIDGGDSLTRRSFTRRQLLEHTDGVERDSVERSIDVHVLNLRRKIEPNPKRPARLVTVYGIGYKLTAGPA